MEHIFYKIISMSVLASIVGIVIFITKEAIKKIPVTLSNILWVFFIILLIFPINIRSKISIKNFISLTQEVPMTNNEVVLDTQEYTTLKISEEKNNVTKVLMTIYVTVGILLSLKDVISYIILRTKIKETKEIPDNIHDVLKNCKERLKIKRNIKIVIQDEIKTPAIIGAISPILLLTPNVQNLSTNEIEFILMHELIHYKKKDVLIYFVLNMLKNIYWFNPVVLCILSVIKRDIEYATDEMVINKLDNYKEYCKLLVKVSCLESKKYGYVAAMSSGKRDLERRIVMLKNRGKIGIKSIIILSLLIVMTFVFSVVLATNRVDEKIESIAENVSEEMYNSPLEGELKISANYGERENVVTEKKIFHNGIDFVADKGAKVMSIANGKVRNTGYSATRGNYVEIEHEKIISEYNHLLKITVENGEKVAAGDEIGEVGSTGFATGPHLHLSIKDKSENYVDPKEYIK